MLTRDCKLEIALERPDGRYRAGEVVRGFVGVLSEEVVACRALTLALVWRTHGRGTPSTGEADKVTLFEGKWEAGRRDLYPFELQLPANGPISFHTDIVQLDWFLMANADVAWAIDPKTELAVQVERPEVPVPLDLGPAYLKLPQISEAWSQGGGALLGVFFALFSLPFHVVSLFMCLGGLSSGDTGMVFFAIPFFLIPSVFTLIGVGSVVSAVRGWRSRRVFSEMEVRAPEAVGAGGLVEVSASFTPKHDLRLDAADFELVCEAYTESGSGTKKRTWREEPLRLRAPATHHSAVRGGEPTRWAASFTLPPDAIPTFASPRARIAWRVELVVRQAGRQEALWKRAFVVDR